MQSQAPARGFVGESPAHLEAEHVVIRADKIRAIVAKDLNILSAPIEDVLQLHEPQTDQEVTMETRVRRPMPVPIGVHDHLIATQSLLDVIVPLEAAVRAAVINLLVC